MTKGADQEDRQQRIAKFCNDLASIEPIALAAFQQKQGIPANFREMIDPIVAEFRLLQPFSEEERDKINEYGYITFRAMSTLHQMLQPMMGLLRDEKPN